MRVKPPQVDIAEVQVVDSHVARDGQAFPLGLAYAIDALVCRKTGKVHLRPRRSRQGEYRIERNRLGRRRYGRQAETHRHLPIVGNSAPREKRILRPEPHAVTECRGVLHGPPQNLVVGERRIGLRKSDASCIDELAHFGQRFTLKANGERSYRIDVGATERAGTMLEHFHQSRLIQRRIGVRRARQTGHAPRDRRLHLGFERRLVFETGLAQARARIDEAGTDDQPRRVDDPVGVPSRGCVADRGNLSGSDEKRRRPVDAMLRIDQAAMVDLDLHFTGRFSAIVPRAQTRWQSGDSMAVAPFNCPRGCS